MEICLNKKPRALIGSCYTSHCNIQKELADKIVKLLELIFGTVVWQFPNILKGLTRRITTCIL